MKGILIFLLFLLCESTAISFHTAFITPVCIKPYKDYRYSICHDVKFIVKKQIFTIPKGFKTDLASIPKIAWPIMAPSHSDLIRAAIVHDWFYRMTCDFNRKDTDLIFYYMLKNDGVSTIRAFLMYYAVRFFGWNYYNEDYC